MKGNPLDFPLVVKEYTGMVYSLAWRILGNKDDTMDAVQETFSKLYHNRHKFSKESSLKNWIYTIGINTARDIYRKRKRKKEVQDVEYYTDSKSHTNPKELENKLFAAKLIEILPLELRIVIVLHYLEDKSIEEIASFLDISESLVKVRLYRARKTMLSEYEASCEHEDF
ncbi:MAG: sigma-70 family RNA polymerase sigma factor [Fibrobacteria bacterium]|nr:sigma-70 family RNA polymerase sigma factor [Fibrobacteria bacterium]